MIQILRRLNSKISIYLERKKRHTTEEEMKQIYSFPEPVDNIERSYFQYQSICFNMENKYFLLLKQIIALIYLLLYVFISSIKRMPECRNKFENVYFGGTNSYDILPDEYNNTVQTKYYPIGKKGYLIKKDYIYILNIWRRYPFSFYFLIKIVVKIASYRNAIIESNPKRILVSCEYSWTSSILTDFCEKQGIEHLNIMHGLIGRSVAYSFCHFTKMYIWEKGFEDIYKDVRAKSQFIISIPRGMLPNIKKYEKKENKFLKYYLQIETKEEIKQISDILKKFQENGYSIKIRPHPLYSNLEVLNNYFNKDEIENNKAISIAESLATALYVCSKYSTVLYQAHLLGIPIILDDMTEPYIYKRVLENGNLFWTTKNDKQLSLIFGEL